MLAEPVEPNYYCHICATEVASQINVSNQEIECAQCSSNFIELLGQGVETFIAGPANPPRILPSSTDRESTRRRERRRAEAIRQPERNMMQNVYNDINGPVRSQGSQHDIINREAQSQMASNHDHNHGRSIGIFTTSAMNIGPNFSSSDSRTMPSPIELGSLMSAFMMGRAAPDHAGNGFLRYAGGGGIEDFLHHIFMNDTSHAGEPPATEGVIESLKRSVVSNSADILELGECSISQEAFELGDISICLPCKHAYKEEPIIHWLKMHNTCPVCRIPLSTMDSNISTTTTEDPGST